VRVLLFIVYIYIAVSVITLTAYFIDKYAAMRKKQRIKESTLHILALFCGWPGACIAQKVLRHKAHKKSFQGKYAASIIVNILGLILYLTLMLLNVMSAKS